MKQTRKLLSLLLALAMVCALAATAFATGPETEPTTTPVPETYSITINNSVAGHTYEAYQIFTGDLYNGILSNIVWGSGISEAGRAALGDAAAKAETLKTEANARSFAKEVAPYLSTVAGSASTVTDGKYVISGLPAGYYLVKDQDGSLTNDNDSYTEYIVKVVEDVTAEPKSDVPTVDKKVKDNDVSAEYKDAADYNIGDSVPFQLKATLANNVSAYTTYKVVFHDTLSMGLTYNRDAKVSIDGKETNGFTVTSTANDDGTTTLTVSCDDVKALGAGNNSVITVEYTATLNQNAEIGNPGNSNKVYLEYSNNPNKSETGNNETGNTPEKEVLVFTYELDTTKVDGQNADTKLKDAKFVLLNSDGTKVAKITNGKFDGWQALPDAGSDGKIAVESWPTENILTSGDNGLFSVTGLDAGTYKLREIVAPAGYNLLKDDITVVITATIGKNDGKSTVTELKVAVDSGTPTAGNTETGIVNVTVENKKGATLPETGGIGTTIFYTVGGILVLVAVVLLVTKKRMNGTEV